MFLSIGKTTYKKLTATIILNVQREMIHSLLLSFLFNRVLEFLARAIWKGKEMKDIKTEKEVELSISRWQDLI